MKYNVKYKRYVSSNGLVYRKDKNGILHICAQFSNHGYMRVTCAKHNKVCVHRLVYETFKGEIPEGMRIDHINNKRDDNRIENLRIFTPKENSAHRKETYKEPKHVSEKRAKKLYGKMYSEFGERFYKCYGIHRKDDIMLYTKEHCYFRKYGYLKGEKYAGQ